MIRKEERFNQSWQAWGCVVLCALAIFFVIPPARSIQGFVSEHLGRRFFGFFVVAAVVAGLAGAISVLWIRLKIRSASNYAWLAALAGLYVYFTIQRWKVPEEAVHFLEYGGLGFFLYRALSRSVKDWTVYLDAVVLGSIIGFIDEIIQWMVPGRYWDFRDAGFNVLASLLFQLAMWKGIRPSAITERVGPRSLKRLSALSAVNLLIIGFCVWNTPDRVAWYTSKIPALAFLRNEEPMREILLKHKNPEIGEFASRLTLEELAAVDSTRAEEFGRLLDDWKNRSYEGFLRTFSTIHNPFLHEMRVHIFRRDKMLARAEAAMTAHSAAASSARKEKAARAKKEALGEAFKENLILETYFGKTLKHSSYAWPPGKKEKLLFSNR